jgi:hypothetical protein
VSAAVQGRTRRTSDRKIVGLAMFGTDLI